VLFLKDEDPEAPNYFLIRDRFASEQPLPAEWNIWALAEKVDLTGAPARIHSRYGVELEVFMAEPAMPDWSTRQDTNRFLANPSRPYLVDQEWVEVLTNLRAQQEPGQGFLAVLYPRKLDEPTPAYETLAGGAGVKVTTPRGTDWAFLADQPVIWQGDGLAFSARPGPSAGPGGMGGGVCRTRPGRGGGPAAGGRRSQGGIPAAVSAAADGLAGVRPSGGHLARIATLPSASISRRRLYLASRFRLGDRPDLDEVSGPAHGQVGQPIVLGFAAARADRDAPAGPRAMPSARAASDSVPIWLTLSRSAFAPGCRWRAGCGRVWCTEDRRP